MMPRLRVVVVDDSPFMRVALARMIEMDDAFEVVGVAASGEEAIELANTLRPDVMTLDVEMPGMGGLQALRVIVETLGTPVLMVSAFTEKEALVTLDALAIGAFDFVPKALKDGERSIFRGRTLLHAKLRAAVEAGGRKPLAGNASRLPVSAARRDVDVVVIGSSTGGPNALQVLFESWRPVVPVLMVQHMPPIFTAAMALRLSRVCAIPVREARDGDALEPGLVLLAPGGTQMRVVKRGIVEVCPDTSAAFYKPSVDVLAESVAAAYGARAVGVMLTGMGSDGAQGFAALKRKGAGIVAQDHQSCVVYGMPKAVVDAGLADDVVGIRDMGAYLKQVVG